MEEKYTSKRPEVLIVAHADGHLEVFVEGNALVRIERMPAAFTMEAERTAEDVFEMLLPARWREVWRRDRLKVVGTTRPLLPSTLAATPKVSESLEEIDAIPARVRNRCKVARERRTA